MKPFLAIATIVAALSVAEVSSDTTAAYVLSPRARAGLSTGWGWRPVKTVTLALPSIRRGWGWKPRSPGYQLGVYGGIRIGKPSGWGWPKQQGWGHGGGHGGGWGQGGGHGGGGGWGWKPQQQQGWGWKPQPQGWGWKQQGWGWDDDDDEDDYRSSILGLQSDLVADDVEDASSEEVADDDDSGSVESDEQDSLESDIPSYADAPYADVSNAIAYDPYYV